MDDRGCCPPPPAAAPQRYQHVSVAAQSVEDHKLDRDNGPISFPLNFFNLLLILKMSVDELIKMGSKRVYARLFCSSPYSSL